MIKLSNNKKGFTLIELLAVIVILAILVILAIPAVTKYLNQARANAFSDNALRAIEAVRNDVIENGFSKSSRDAGDPGNCDENGVCTYYLTDINELLEKKLQQSPYGEKYKCVKIIADEKDSSYTMTMVDLGNNGFTGKLENSINKSAVNVHNNANAAVDSETACIQDANAYNGDDTGTDNGD